MTPGMQVSVVNSYAAMALVVVVNLVSSVDFPTDGNLCWSLWPQRNSYPIKDTLASPALRTSKPSPPPFGPFNTPSRSCALKWASLALSIPKWCSVALLR